jgi:hypothetical protein
VSMEPVEHTPARIVGGIPYFEEYLKLADRISKTAMVPGALRGKPDEVLAVVMYGAELGIGPMQALQQINFIAGKPSAAAELLRALVMEAGHQFIIEADATRATAECKRKDWEEWRTVTFTIDDAHRANLGSGDGWKKYPDQMLSARVTSKACRMYFPDVISGMSYTPEEITEFSTPEIVKAKARPAREPETVQRSAPVVESDPSTEEQRQQIKDGLEMLAPDERARFGIWWIETGYPKGVQNLSVHDANDVWSALFAILNEDNVIEGEIVIEPKRTLVEPPEPVVEATQSRLMSEPNPNGPSQKQMDFIRSLCDGMGADPYYKSSSILNKEVTSLKALTKSEAKKLVDALIAERDGAK